MPQDYKLTPSDFGVWPNTIRIQSILGAGTPTITDAIAGSIEGAVEAVSGSYPAILNTQLKSWTETFFTNLASVTTTYDNRKFPEVYVANKYREYITGYDLWSCINPQFYYQAFASGADSDSDKRYYGDCMTWHVGPWGRVAKPDNWSTSVNSVFTTWGTAGIPADLSGVTNLYSTTSWTNISSLKTAVTALWTSQSAAVADLQTRKELDNDACVFLLYLLCALGTGDNIAQALVKKIVNTTTNSIELVNDTFIDTLVYYVMMTWVDPIGDYGFNSDQIKSTLNNLNNAMVNTDDGTKIIKTSIGKSLKIINAQANYPMTDPYNPGIGFSTRQSDVLEGLNAVWPCK